DEPGHSVLIGNRRGVDGPHSTVTARAPARARSTRGPGEHTGHSPNVFFESYSERSGASGCVCEHLSAHSGRTAPKLAFPLRAEAVQMPASKQYFRIHAGN